MSAEENKKNANNSHISGMERELFAEMRSRIEDLREQSAAERRANLESLLIIGTLIQRLRELNASQESPERAETSAEGTGFLPPLRDKLPFWPYALAVIVATVFEGLQGLAASPETGRAIPQFLKSLTFALPLHVLSLLGFGFWIGLRRRGIPWLVYIATGLCAGILITVTGAAVIVFNGYLMSRTAFNVDEVLEIMFSHGRGLERTFPSILGYALLFVSGTLLGNAVQRRGLNKGLYGGSNGGGRSSDALKVALLGAAALILANSITAIATLASN